MLDPGSDFADSTQGLAIFAGQVIERQGAPRARTPKIGVVPTKSILMAANVPIIGGPSCSWAAKFAGRMANNTATVALGEADQKARPGEEQKQAEGDFEPALWQRMREARAERCDPARDRRDRNDADQGDEADR
jgi:hypothetical protein